MSNQTDFILNSRSDVVELDLIEISHSKFTTSYRIVRNAIDGITLPEGRFFQYYPAVIEMQDEESNLDYGLKISLGDLSEVLPPEMRALRATDSLDENPLISYYLYRSDDLSEPMNSILGMKLTEFSFDRVNSYLIARADRLNTSKTGRTYNFEDFPMLEGFV